MLSVAPFLAVEEALNAASLAHASGVLLPPYQGASGRTRSNSDVPSGNEDSAGRGEEEGENGVGPGVALGEERNVGADDMAIV